MTDVSRAVALELMLDAARAGCAVWSSNSTGFQEGPGYLVHSSTLRSLEAAGLVARSGVEREGRWVLTPAGLSEAERLEQGNWPVSRCPECHGPREQAGGWWRCLWCGLAAR